MDLFAMYQAAWQVAREAGAFVRYQGMWPDLAGYMDARHGQPDQRPLIHIYRIRYSSPGSEASRVLITGEEVPEHQLRSELVTFAHEYGHLMSYLGDTPREQWLAYHAVETKRSVLTAAAQEGARTRNLDADGYDVVLRSSMQSDLTEEQRELVIREESLAWKLGRELLEALGYDDMTTVDGHVVHGLHHHRYRLGIDALWACDGATPRCAEVHA